MVEPFDFPASATRKGLLRPTGWVCMPDDRTGAMTAATAITATTATTAAGATNGGR